MWYALARAAIAVWRQGHAGAATPAPPPAGSGLSDKQPPAYLARGRHVRGRYAKPGGAAVAPTFSQQPASASRTVGQQAQFLAVVQGTAPFTVRWKKNGTVVATTTHQTAPATAIYTTPALTLSDNGSSFVAEASNAAASNVASSTATLSVTQASSPSPSPSPSPPPGGGKHVSNSILDGLSLELLTARLTQMQLAYLDLSSGAKPQVVSYSQADGSKSVSYTQADLGRLAQAIKAVQAQIDALNGVTSNRRRPMRPLF
jgi:hypothetical protein